MSIYDIRDHNQPINPFIKVGKTEKQKVFYKLDEEVNNPNRFAILRTTENGKFVRGEMLYYKLDNVEIYTELNNIIFVDRVNKTLTVKDYSKALEEINPENPETRQYIILMYLDDDVYEQGAGTTYTWEAMEGRQLAYQYIKDNIGMNYMNPDKSIVLTDNVAVKDALTVTQFIKYLKNGNLVPEDDFEIDDYRSGDEENE